MNRLDPPITFDDAAALDTLASNVRLGSYPALAAHLIAIKAGYSQYVGVHGNVLTITPVVLPKALGKSLISHYASPPQDLTNIGELREESAVGTCPMCGSLHTWSLDHVLPKETHPAFAIFTPNLVPACHCNTKRGTALVGPNPGERILHPYFDDVLAERNLAARFDDLGRAPRITIRVLRHHTDPAYPAVSFHLEKVVLPAGARRYMIKRWARLVRQPSAIAANLSRRPQTLGELTDTLERERDRADDSRESKNNWDSLFLTGLLDAHVIGWLFDRLVDPLRNDDAPLRI
ncbi:hypothetical protein [Phenylobacterium sp.]|uniref:hypothetical protein n=1 Tax=Phenylobacterium sp. TaxID=1871053 RepID=UPI0025E1C8A4|nr:hypothetical protein [Phenylobacterium sp.]